MISNNYNLFYSPWPKHFGPWTKYTLCYVYFFLPFQNNIIKKGLNKLFRPEGGEKYAITVYCLIINV